MEVPSLKDGGSSTLLQMGVSITVKMAHSKWHSTFTTDSSKHYHQIRKVVDGVRGLAGLAGCVIKPEHRINHYARTRSLYI